MNIRRICLSGLFSLVAGVSATLFPTKSEAEVTSWVSGFPSVGIVEGDGSSYEGVISELCQAMAEGPNSLLWKNTTYHAGAQVSGWTYFNNFLTPNVPKPDPLGRYFEGFAPGSRVDCLAVTTGTDTVTGAFWAGSTGDTWVTIPTVI